MRSQRVLQYFCLFLAVSIVPVSSFAWIGMALGALEGAASGAFKGTIGAFGPIAKDGLNSMKDFFGGLNGAANQGMGGAGSLANSGMGGAGSLANSGMGGAGSLANSGMGGLGGAMNQGFGGLGSIFNQIISSWGSIFSQLFNGGGDVFGTFFGIMKSLLKSFFSILGSLNGSSRLQVNRMIANTGNVFASAMKLKLSPKKDSDDLKNEMLAVQKIMESNHSNHQVMVKAIKTNAPQLSFAVQEAFKHANVELQKHMKTLSPEAKKGVQKMRLEAVKAKLNIGSLISSMMGNGSSIFSTGINLIKNLLGMVKMFV